MTITTVHAGGRDHDIRDMPFPFLQNTYNKRLGELGPDHEIVQALKAEIIRRPMPAEGTVERVSLAEAVGTPRPRDAVIGDNNPPTDAELLTSTLERRHEDILKRQMDLALRRARLPETVNTDDELAMVNAYVADAGRLRLEADKLFKDDKQPYYDLGRVVDAFWDWRAGLADSAKRVAQRATAFLVAKQQAEAAKRAAEEAEKRAAAEAARKVQEAEAINAALAAKAAAEAAEKLRQAETPEARQEAETELRTSTQEAKLASNASEQAGKDANRATREADRDARAIDSGAGLSRTAVGGASARVEMERKARVKSYPALIQSLGPLGQFFNEATIMAALEKAAKSQRTDLAVPGVEFYEEPVTKTALLRT